MCMLADLDWHGGQGPSEPMPLVASELARRLALLAAIRGADGSTAQAALHVPFSSFIFSVVIV